MSERPMTSQQQQRRSVSTGFAVRLCVASIGFALSAALDTAEALFFRPGGVLPLLDDQAINLSTTFIDGYNSSPDVRLSCLDTDGIEQLTFGSIRKATYQIVAGTDYHLEVDVEAPGSTRGNPKLVLDLFRGKGAQATVTRKCQLTWPMPPAPAPVPTPASTSAPTSPTPVSIPASTPAPTDTDGVIIGVGERVAIPPNGAVALDFGKLMVSRFNGNAAMRATCVGAGDITAVKYQHGVSAAKQVTATTTYYATMVATVLRGGSSVGSSVTLTVAADVTTNPWTVTICQVAPPSPAATPGPTPAGIPANLIGGGTIVDPNSDDVLVLGNFVVEQFNRDTSLQQRCANATGIQKVSYGGVHMATRQVVSGVVYELVANVTVREGSGSPALGTKVQLVTDVLLPPSENGSPTITSCRILTPAAVPTLPPNYKVLSRRFIRRYNTLPDVRSSCLDTDGIERLNFDSVQTSTAALEDNGTSYHLEVNVVAPGSTRGNPTLVLDQFLPYFGGPMMTRQCQLIWPMTTAHIEHDEGEPHARS